MKLPRIYIADNNSKMAIDKALNMLTEEFIDNGELCPQTAIDLVRVCKVLKKFYDENNNVKKACKYCIAKSYCGTFDQLFKSTKQYKSAIKVNLDFLSCSEFKLHTKYHGDL